MYRTIYERSRKVRSIRNKAVVRRMQSFRRSIFQENIISMEKIKVFIANSGRYYMHHYYSSEYSRTDELEEILPFNKDIILNKTLHLPVSFTEDNKAMSASTLGSIRETITTINYLYNSIIEPILVESITPESIKIKKYKFKHFYPSFDLD